MDLKHIPESDGAAFIQAVIIATILGTAIWYGIGELIWRYSFMDVLFGFAVLTMIGFFLWPFIAMHQEFKKEEERVRKRNPNEVD